MNKENLSCITILTVWLTVVGFFVCGSTLFAQDATWTEIQGPDTTLATDVEAGFPNGCGIVSMLYAMKFGPPSWRADYNSIAGKTDLAKIQTLAKQFGSEPSKYERAVYNRNMPAFTASKGTNVGDLPWMFQSLVHGPLPLNQVFLAKLDPNGNTGRLLAEKFHNEVVASLKRGEPVIMTAFIQFTVHEIVIIGIQNAVDQQGTFKVEVLDPATGEESTGTVSSGFSFITGHPGTGLNFSYDSVWVPSGQIFGITVEPK